MSVPIELFGNVKGNLKLRASGRMPAPDVLLFHPEIQTQLDDIVKQGWTYLYIECVATAEAEISVEKSQYRIGISARPDTTSHGPPENVIELNIGPEVPEIKSIPEVIEFRVNVCSKSFPRAATVELTKGIVTYLDDPYWRWQKGWENDPKKLSNAKEISEIATWLLDVKKYKLHEVFTEVRYKELSGIFKGMSH
jgi:hypothetical protein